MHVCTELQLLSQVREHCLAQLSKALRENCVVCAAAAGGGGGDVETAAVELEYTVFLSVKSVQVYKLTIHKKVHSLQPQVPACLHGCTL